MITPQTRVKLNILTKRNKKKGNKCITYTNEKRGDIFVYHNLDIPGKSAIENFSRFVDDEITKQIYTSSCSYCKTQLRKEEN